MYAKKLIAVTAVFLQYFFMVAPVKVQKELQSEIWRFDSLTNINGYSVEQMGQPHMLWLAHLVKRLVLTAMEIAYWLALIHLVMLQRVYCRNYI